MPYIDLIPGGSATLHQGLFFAIVAAAIGLLVTERLSPDAVALLIVIALAATGILAPEQALAGFHSEPAIVIACMFVLSAAFQHTGLSESLGRWIGRLAGRALPRMLAVIVPAVALLSAFTHHVTMTAVMLPVTLDLARRRGVAPSKLLAPLAIGSSLGTTITIVGAPSFLVASALLQQAGRPGLQVFSIAPIGLSLTLAGTLYMVLVGRYLLPTRRGGADPASLFRLEAYFTELAILPGSPLVGKSPRDVRADRRYRIDVVGLVRDGRHVPPPLGERRLAEGDVVLAHTTPNQLATVGQEPGIELHPVMQYGAEAGTGPRGRAADGDEPLVQAIIAPDSELVGRTLAQVQFHRQYGALVVALWRRGERLAGELAGIRLRAGDVLVLQGDADTLARLREQRRDFLMLVPFHGEPRRRGKAVLAGAIMLATVLAVAFDWLTLAMGALAGATAMVLARCLTPRQAYRAIDARMYVFVAGAIPLGKAMKETGAADLLAGWLQGAVGGWDERLILLALFATVGVVVQFMGSDAATTALFGPMAIALAGTLGQAPEAYMVTVAIAAVTAVFTPMAHHNLLVYAPGGYRFADFFRVGAPLTVLIGLIVVALAPVLWHV